MFGIARGSEAHIFQILRDHIYTNKVLAVLREYACNAYDAHIASGRRRMPIHVSLPTQISPTCIIRDFGSGLSEEDVFGIYPMYGTSTKRESVDEIGNKGIGSKAAFAYADSFSITSFYGGMKTIYTAVIDPTKVGRIDKFCSTPCGDETGIEIRVPVKEQDIASFHKEAAFLFQFFDPQPTFNIDLSSHETFRSRSDYAQSAHGFTVSRSKDEPWGQWLAVIGGVPYKLRLDQIEDDLRTVGLEHIARATSGGIFFKLGEVDIAPSREELEFTDQTKTIVLEKIKSFLAKFIEDANEILNDPAKSSWQKRLDVRAHYTRVGIPVPEIHKLWAADTMSLYFRKQCFTGDGIPIMLNGKPVFTGPETFHLEAQTQSSTTYTPILEHVEGVKVSVNTRLIVIDTKVKKTDLSRAYQYRTDVFVRVHDKSYADELQEYLDIARLDGIPIVNISSLQAAIPRFSNPNVKHRSKYFRLIRSACRKHPLSKNWEVVDHELQDDDVVVILSQFDVVGDASFFNDIQMKIAAVEMLGGTFPHVYGIKTTAKNPVKDVKGVAFNTWFKNTIATLVQDNAKIAQQINTLHWASEHRAYYYSQISVKTYEQLFGMDHVISRWVRKHLQATRESPSNAPILELVAQQMQWKNIARQELTSLFQRYPLLQYAESGLWVFKNEVSRQAWADYVHIIDKVNP